MARYDDPVKYTKTLKLITSDGEVELTQNEARTMQKTLEDNPRFVSLYDATTKKTTYYDMDSAACGFCKVAELTSGKAEGEPLPCEDPIPNCPALEFEEVTPTGDGKENPARDGWYEKDGDKYVPSSDVVVVSGKTYYKVKTSGDES